MDVLELINYIKKNPNKDLLAITRDLLKCKFEFNIVILIDNKNKSKIIGHKIFSSGDLLTQFIVNLPMKYGFAYFNNENNTYFSGASFFDQGWICELNGESVTTIDYYDQNLRSADDFIVAGQLDLFEVSSKIKVVV